MCPLCGAADGDELHRLLSCAGWEELRRKHLNAETRIWLQSTALPRYGLTVAHLRLPAWAVRRPALTPEHEQIHWSDGPRCFQHTVFTDGSAVHSAWRDLRQCAWAAVEVDTAGRERWYARGRVPVSASPEQSVMDAELYALLMVGRHSTGQVRIYTDSQAVFAGVRTGCAAMAARGCKRRHLWMALAAAGEERLEVCKVKAHLPQPLVGAAPEEHFKWQGNDAADKRARGVLVDDAETPQLLALRCMTHLASWAGLQVEQMTKGHIVDTVWPETWQPPPQASGPKARKTRNTW
eukprot:1475626-Amphidinium_carterae.2